MINRRSWERRALLTTALACFSAGMAQADETAAREILTAMSTYLAAQPVLSFDVDSSLDVITTDGQKLTIASSGSISMERPDKLHVMRRGGFASVEASFDGKTLSVLNADENVFAQADMAGTIDQLIDLLRDQYARPLPAADLLGTDGGAVLLSEATVVQDLGSGVIRGEECDHIALRGAEVDWQIWVAQGETPHPCRLTITSKTIAGSPDYTLDFSAWGAGAASASYGVTAPEGAKTVDVKDIPNLDELAGIYQTNGGN